MAAVITKDSIMAEATCASSKCNHQVELLGASPPHTLLVQADLDYAVSVKVLRVKLRKEELQGRPIAA